MTRSVELLTNLNLGASACAANAERLTDDSERLFFGKSYLSSYFLSELAIEETGKAFKLLVWISDRKEASKDDWERLVGRFAHINKLTIAHEADDEWLASVTKGVVDYAEFQKAVLSRMPSARNMDEYRRARAKESFDLRKLAMYVDYDFQNKEWVNPVALHIASDPTFSFQKLNLAKHMTQILRAKMKGQE